MVFRTGGHVFFVHGFAKSDKSNITAGELAALKRLAAVLSALDAEAIERAAAAGEIAEIRIDGEGNS